MNYKFKTETDYKISLQKAEEQEDIIKIKISIDFEKKSTPKPVVIRWTHPCKNVFSQWNPQLWSTRTLNPNWMPIKNGSRSAEGTPVQTHLSLDGINEITVSVSDPLVPMEIATGIIEETAEISYKLTLFTKLVSPMDKYETVLTIDTRKLPYEKVLADTIRLWYEETSVPEAAKEPMYSTWYSYHQNLSRHELIAELKLAKQLGMETVIVDDGWQTLNGQRGYAHCGDWEPERLSDMKGFVSDVHDVGMKCMLWFGVPFVGKYSKAWAKFQGKFLDAYDEHHPWCVLDPRYPEVREYLTDIYEKAVKEWDIDGLKLDFINNMQLTEASSAPDNNMDYVSLEDAICALLAEIKERLTALKSDILIEFRQPYTGPVMRRYGNMLRVADCPQDAVKNRAGVVDLRLLAHKTAVHSDMLMWNYDDTPESAALQLINAIFSVPQVSVLIEKLCEEQRKMLEFYLRFWKENKHCLIDGKLSAENPESFYSLITSESENKIIAASYIKNVMNIKKAYNEIIFINGSWDDELFINNKYDDMKSECTIYTCTGEIKESKEIILKKGVNVFNIPKSGLVKLSISG